MALLLAFALAIEDLSAPTPFSRWNISYLPENAALASTGDAMLFQGNQAFRYDRDGNLLGNYALTFAPRAVFLGPNDTVWVHDGKSLLAKLNDNFNPQWQRDMPPPAARPFPFKNLLAYAVDDRVQLLDLGGDAQFTWLHTAPIASMLAYRNRIVIADANGEVASWEPFSGRKDQLFANQGGGDSKLQFVAPGPQGGLALAYSDGLLRALRGTQQRRWTRDFRIRIPVAPIWLSANNRVQLMAATDGRDAYAFGERGEQLARTLFSGRPRALIKWSETLALIVPGLVDQLIWYRADGRRFIRQPMESRQNLVAVNGPYVMMIDNDGTIRLYQREAADP